MKTLVRFQLLSHAKSKIKSVIYMYFMQVNGYGSWPNRTFDDLREESSFDTGSVALLESLGDVASKGCTETNFGIIRFCSKRSSMEDLDVSFDS